MSSPQALTMNYSWPNGQTVDENQVDSWELKASRRALRNLKTLLAGQPMLDLLQKQIEESDAYYKDIIEKSNGQYRECRTDIHAKGITYPQFMAWWKVWFIEHLAPETKQKSFLDTLSPAHPEHYTVPSYGGGIVETIGERVVRLTIKPETDSPDFVKAYGDPTFTQTPATVTLDDGSIFAYILHEARGSEDGCDFRMRALFPAAAPEILFEEHTQHFAVEFRSFISTAYEWNQKTA